MAMLNYQRVWTDMYPNASDKLICWNECGTMGLWQPTIPKQQEALSFTTADRCLKLHICILYYIIVINCVYTYIHIPYRLLPFWDLLYPHMPYKDIYIYIWHSMASILKIMIGHIPAFIGPIWPSSQSKSRRYLTPLAAFLWWHGFTDDFYRLGMGGGHDW